MTESYIETVRRALRDDPRTTEALAIFERSEGDPAAQREAAAWIAEIGTGAWERVGVRAPDDGEQAFIEAIDRRARDIPADADPAAIAKALGGAVYKHLRTAARMAAEKPPPALAARTAWDRPPAARRWLIAGWLPAGRVTLFAGSGGGGKSKLALQLAFNMADGGAEWFPGGPELAAEAQRATVCFATYEDEPDEIMRRLLDAPAASAAPHAAQAVGAAVADRLHALDLAPHGPLWGPPRGGHIATRAGLTPAGQAVRSYCEARGARLLVLDSLAGVYSGSEIDRAAVREFLASWDAWGREHDCATLIIAHPAKADAGDGYSGSTDWHNGVRSRWTFEPHFQGDGKERQRSGNMVLAHRKSNYSRTAGELTVTNWHWWTAIQEEAGERNPYRRR